MDPYLEGSEWSSVHNVLAVMIGQQLNPLLVPRYVARIVKRHVFTSLDGEDDVRISGVCSDISVVQRVGAKSLATLVAPAAPAAPITMATVVPERFAEITIEIRNTAERHLVTAIELLSPANKHGSSRLEYLERRRRLLSSSAHLIEIDLLRRGHRVPMQQPLPSVPYFVMVGRAGRRPLTQVWPISLRQPLPVIPVPLSQGDADVSLDLQRALNETYEGCAFGVSVEYQKPPETSLSDEDAAWAKQRVAEWIGPEK